MVLMIIAQQGAFEKNDFPASADGEGYVWLEKGDPRMIRIVQEGPVNKRVTWYFLNQKLIHSETIWWDAQSNKKLYEEKTYHQNGVLFSWLGSDHKFVDANSQEFKSMDRKLQEYSQQLIEKTREEPK